MSWVKIDDDLPTHPKLAGLTPSARWRFLELLCLCSKFETDGILHESWTKPRKIIDNLLTNRLLDRDSETKRISVHDYLEYQPSSDARKAAREATTARQASFRSRKRNAVSNASPVQSRPVPSPKEEEVEQPAPKRRRASQPKDQVDEDFISKMVKKYQAIPEPDVRSEITAATSHKSAGGWTKSPQTGVRRWLAREFGGSNGNTIGNRNGNSRAPSGRNNSSKQGGRGVSTDARGRGASSASRRYTNDHPPGSVGTQDEGTAS